MKDRFMLVMSCFLMLLGFLILLFVASGCGPRRTKMGSIGVSEHIEDQYKRAVRIKVVCVNDKGDKTLFSGSGVIIDRYKVLTAFHIIGNCKNPEVTIIKHNAKTYRAMGGVGVKTHDVMLLFTEKPIGPKRILRIASPDDAVILCLMPGMPTRVRKCGVMVYYKPHLPQQSIRFDALTVSGNSGSGIYDLRGALVGIVTHGLKTQYIETGMVGTWGTAIEPLREILRI